MDANQYLQRLRTLQKQLADANVVYDRFGRADQLKQIEQIEAQIQAIPQALRDQVYCDEIRMELPAFVESYLLKRAARFIEGTADLKDALLRMVTTPDPLITTNLQLARVAKGLPALQQAGTLDEDLDIAIELAQSFDETRKVIGSYYVTFERFVREYLGDRERFRVAQGHLDEADDLRAALRQWQANIVEYRANFAAYDRVSSDPTIRLQVARRRVVSQVVVLQLLGAGSEHIENRMADIQGNWNAKQAP